MQSVVTLSFIFSLYSYQQSTIKNYRKFQNFLIVPEVGD